MGEFFPNQYWGMDIWKHQELPIIESHDFNFFRCLEFNNSYYGKTVSELHSGNLRLSRKDNRYSNLFPGQKLSYWADSPQTARAEIKKWGSRHGKTRTRKSHLSTGKNNRYKPLPRKQQRLKQTQQQNSL